MTYHRYFLYISMSINTINELSGIPAIHLQIKKLALQLSLGEREVLATVELLDSGATLPFIARYRKEATGNLDEVAIARIRDQLYKNRQLEERRDAILHSLAKRELLTADLQAKLQAADTLARLEDIYLPFRPKRKTRATVAKERGLEPLAKRIFAQDQSRQDPEKAGIILCGCREGCRLGKRGPGRGKGHHGRVDERGCRGATSHEGPLSIAGLSSGPWQLPERGESSDAKDDAKFRDYLDYSEALTRASPHRLLAMLRGARAGALSLHVAPAEEDGPGGFRGTLHKGKRSGLRSGDAGSRGRLPAAPCPLHGK